MDKMSEGNEYFDWDYLPCVRIGAKSTGIDVIISIDDIIEITNKEQGLIEGKHEGFFVVEDEIVSIFQSYPEGPVAKKPISRVPLTIFKSILEDIERY